MYCRARLRVFGVAVTVFGCGWVLMALEILGGRMLAPDFGSGVSVWGSVISVFLLALSVGYYLGGLVSQRFPAGAGLALVILLAAASILPVAWWHRALGERIVEMELSEQWGSLLAAGTLFFVPSALLGAVSPYAVRLVTRSVTAAGASAGTLYALSTVGSFLGCLTTAFYLIVWLGIQHLLFLSAAALLLLSLWLAATWYLGEESKRCES